MLYGFHPASSPDDGSGPILPGFEPPSIPPGIRLITLENGLTIIVREDRSAPVVSAQAWCLSGSIHEDRWLGAGLSHVLEHMLFKGTTTRGPSRIDQEIQEAGGAMNAYTSFDRTVYFINVPNTGARVAIDILCDIVQNATLPPEELEKEKDVIRREMDMNQDDPGRRSSRRLFETAFTRSPYRYTIIGYPSIFAQVTRGDLLAYYRDHYVPRNLLIVVVGDLDARDVETQIRTAFEAARDRALPPQSLSAEPLQMAAREVIEEAPIELAHFHFAWHVPGLRHPDLPALDVLSTLLGIGRSSRLYQQVREIQGLVESVEAWTYVPGDAGLVGISAVAEAGRFHEARAAILAEVDRIQRDSITSGELAKAIRQFTVAALATRKTMQGQAQDLGASWMAANDLSFSSRYLDRVKRVTTEDVRRVACEYLIADHRTAYALLPPGSAPALASSAASAADLPIQRFSLSHGLRLLVKEDHRLPFVEFRIVFQGGVLCESAPRNGLTLLLSRLLLKGTPTRSAERIASEIESLGGSIDSYAGNNSLGVNLEVLRSDFATGLDLMADVVRRPLFPPEALELEKSLQLATLKSLHDQVLPTASRALRRALFGPQGYGLDVNGEEESVAAISIEDVRQFHQRLAAPGNAVLAVYGDVQAASVLEAVTQALGDWPAQPSLALPDPPASSAGSRRVVEHRDKKQAVVLIGFPGASIFDPDRYALELIQEACSDLGSRLFLRIREKLGLAYYVGAQNVLGLVPGYFAFYAGTAPEQAAQVEKEMLAEAQTLRSEGLTPEELQRAKAKLIGQKKIARQDLGSLAQTTALDELYGLGYEHIDREDALYQAVTLDQIRSAACRFLTLDRCVTALVQPPPS